ncbi:hypothetical protein [Streptomyces decoyicus]|uniref:hypothetical protein n=1 Tax=Streptomyces decoyicus TaxID=249567 RepID=UPI00386ECF91
MGNVVRHSRSRPSTGRARIVPLVLAAGVGALLLSGCSGTGEPKSDGHTPDASAPARLWPERSPAPRPTYDEDERDTYDAPWPSHGMPRVPSGDIRKVPALTIVKAQVAAGKYPRGTAQFLQADRQKINNCATARKQCPVLTPQYRDVTGDGKDELLAGIEAGNDELVLWIFKVRNGTVSQILDIAVAPLSLEVAGRDVITREPSELTGYDTRTVYSWDEHSQSMIARVSDYVAVDATTTRKSTS